MYKIISKNLCFPPRIHNGISSPGNTYKQYHSVPRVISLHFYISFMIANLESFLILCAFFFFFYWLGLLHIYG